MNSWRQRVEQWLPETGKGGEGRHEGRSVMSTNIHLDRRNKSGTERQTSHVLTYLCDLKIKTIEFMDIEIRKIFSIGWKG